MTQRYDLAVIGSGPGGYRAAVRAALRGLSVALVERGDWGGCCLNRGCVPKKDWHHTARLLTAQDRFADRGLRGRLEPDLEAAWRHQRAVVQRVRESYQNYLRQLKVTAMEGHARFTGPHTLAVTGGAAGPCTLEARHILIATGGEPHVPAPFHPLPGRVLTTDLLFEQPPPPGRRVAVIGSGVVATEMAFILAALGREVVWLARSPMLRRQGFSRPARKALEEALGATGVRLHSGRRFESVDTAGDGVTLTLDGDERITVDWVCLGTGRRPHTAGLDLERAGVETDAAGFVRREGLRTGAGHILAIGDVANLWMTANHALAEAGAAVDRILDGGTHAPDPLQVPVVVYSALELARLGLDEDAAEDAGLEPAVGFAAFATSPCALGQDEPRGFVRLVGDLDRGTLLGGEIVGAQAGELIHLLSLAPDADTALAWIARGRYNHPARAEEVLNAAETLGAKWGLGQAVWGSLPGDGEAVDEQ
ncbi:dihydrolipoyl dehydrogenase family protein [Ectothiorhodospira mobilis]|uniref:dihydrolipoyl dehydrogenase family protein n=1 Tax=Ectothiorhodospira mobilis TaxID=195064 RepID=UPI001EE93700|nr:NAD(P)/FAD-dependent oxidoreductase [Ectothiorhodospira mobilis]MCG5536414.1 NAD(P)/FAD-dependent oxidoreductase [Ectothiorhodospira mobilis]